MTNINWNIKLKIDLAGASQHLYSILVYLFKKSVRALLGPRTCKANVVPKDRHSSQDNIFSYEGVITKCLALLVHITHQHISCQYVNNGFGKEPSRNKFIDRALGRPGISEKGFLHLQVAELNTVA